MSPSASELRGIRISELFEWSKAYEKKNGIPVTVTLLMNRTYRLFSHRFVRRVTRKSYVYAVMDMMRLERLRDDV